MADKYTELALDSQLGISPKSIDARKELVNVLTGTNLIQTKSDALLPKNAPQVKGCVLGRNGDTGYEYSPDEILIARDSGEAYEMFQAKMAFDDTYSYNNPSAGVPEVLATIWTQQPFKQLLQPTKFEELTTPYQQGMWETENIMIPVLQGSFESKPYADYGSGGQVGMNLNYISNETVRLQTTITYGDLAVARISQAKLDLVGILNENAVERIKQDINRIGFFGYQGGNADVGTFPDYSIPYVRVFGLLNNPGLNANLTAAASASNPSSSLWYYKTALEIYQDIQALYAEAYQISKGVLNIDVPAILGVANAVYIYLTNANSLMTNTTLSFLKEVFPKLEIIAVPDYDGTGDPIGSENPNYCQLIFPEVNGQKTALNAFCSLWRDHGAIRQPTYIERVISYTIAGFVTPIPMAIITMDGI